MSDQSGDISVKYLLNKLDPSLSCILLTRFLCIILEHLTQTLGAGFEASVHGYPAAAVWRLFPPLIAYKCPALSTSCLLSKLKIKTCPFCQIKETQDILLSCNWWMITSSKQLLIYIKLCLWLFKILFRSLIGVIFSSWCVSTFRFYFPQKHLTMPCSCFRMWTSTARPKTPCRPSLLTSERPLRPASGLCSLIPTCSWRSFSPSITWERCNNGSSWKRGSRRRPTCVFGCLNIVSAHFNWICQRVFLKHVQLCPCTRRPVCGDREVIIL